MTKPLIAANDADYSPWAADLPGSTSIIGYGDYGWLIVSRAYPERIAGLNRIGIDTDRKMQPLLSDKLDKSLLMRMRRCKDHLPTNYAAADTIHTNREKLLDLLSVPQRVVLVAGLGNSIGVFATRLFLQYLHLAKLPVLLVAMTPWIYAENRGEAKGCIRSIKQVEADSVMLKIRFVDLLGKYTTKLDADLKLYKESSLQEFFNETAVEIRGQIDSWLGLSALQQEEQQPDPLPHGHASLEQDAPPLQPISHPNNHGEVSS